MHQSGNGTLAIREGKWKLIFGSGSGGRAKPRSAPGSQPFQLYDLEKDLAETNDLAAAHPEIVKRMSLHMNELVINGRSRAGAPAKNEGPEVWKGMKWVEVK